MKEKARRNLYQEIQAKESGNGVPIPNSPPRPSPKLTTAPNSRTALSLAGSAYI